MNYIMVCRRYERVAGVCILDEFEVHKNDEFLEKADHGSGIYEFDDWSVKL